MRVQAPRQYSMSAWDEYIRWNAAVAETVYAEHLDAAPAYLDLDDDVLRALASQAGHEGDAREGLVRAVRGVTVSGDQFSLRTVEQQLRAWRQSVDPSTAPPCLAFLAVTVLAAEDMGNGDADLDQSDYYSRLCRLLALPRDSMAVRNKYRASAEALWGSLNWWLERLEGLRGTPTAYSLSYRYIGLPMSQALVRETDRKKLPAFFAHYGLAGGMDLAPEALQRLLEAWFADEACPASAPLKRLWRKTNARERIATVAAVELAGWDGVVDSAHGASTAHEQRVGLLAHLRRGFRGQSLELALTFRASSRREFDGQMEVESAAGEWLPLAFVPSAANLWRTGATGYLDIESALTGVVRIRVQSEPSSAYQRRPRTVIPLVFDELQAAFVEQERLQLNVDCALLIRTGGHATGILERVLRALGTSARPGFKLQLQQDLQGVPVGWALVSGVQLFSAPQGAPNELVPLARDQLTVAGGLRIPSRVRKWSAIAPPELRVSVGSGQSMRLELRALEDDALVEEFIADDGALVVSLLDLSLSPGDYRASVFSGGSSSPLQQVTVRLRSALEPDAGWGLAPRLVYEMGGERSVLGVLTATEVTSAAASPFVDGAVSAYDEPVEKCAAAPTRPVWTTPRTRDRVRPQLQVAAPDPSSCVVTGAHNSEFPTWFGTRTPRFIEGVCKYCGLVSRSPGWPRPRRTAGAVASEPVVQVTSLAPVGDDDERALWDAALDALMHLGGGDAGALAGISAQMDGSAVFAANFSRRLEALGHIAVERAPRGTPQRWEVSPSCLVEVADGLQFVGFWPDNTVAQVLPGLTALGGTLHVVADADSPTRRVVTGVDSTVAAEALVGTASVVQRAGEGVAAALPPLSQVGAQLQREAMPGFVEAERYDVASSAWLRTADMTVPGAFRLIRGFETTYVFRAGEDVAAGLAARTSVYLAKHLAANLLGVTLAHYLHTSKRLVVPRGCELPGLYERAAVLDSGSLPHPERIVVGGAQRQCLAYGAVSPTLASLLCDRLSR